MFDLQHLQLVNKIKHGYIFNDEKCNFVTCIEKAEIYHLFNTFLIKYKRVDEAAFKLVRSINLIGKEIIAEDIMSTLDDMIYTYRKMRKRCIRIGFVKIKAMDEACNLITVLDIIVSVYQCLVTLQYKNYWPITKSDDLICYIHKFKNLVQISSKWVDRLLC